MRVLGLVAWAADLPVDEMLMDQIPGFIVVLIALAIVAIIAIIVQRKWGS